LFPLPDHQGRCQLIDLYYKQNVQKIVQRHNNRYLTPWARFRTFVFRQVAFIIKLDQDIFVGEHMEKVSKALEGFSGREISKLMIAMQSALYASVEGSFSCQDAWQLVQTKVLEHEEKKRMIRAPLSTTYNLPLEQLDEDEQASESHEEIDPRTELVPHIHYHQAPPQSRINFPKPSDFMEIRESLP